MTSEDVAPSPSTSDYGHERIDRPPAPQDQERCEDAYDLEIGHTVSTADDVRPWVFIGWRHNSAGRSPWFVRSVEGRDLRDPDFYSAAIAQTLARRFPDVERYRRGIVRK